MSGIVKIHDQALDYETDIEIGVKELSNLRNKMCGSQDVSYLQLIVPVLNTLIKDAEAYKEWVLQVAKKVLTEAELYERYGYLMDPEHGKDMELLLDIMKCNGIAVERWEDGFVIVG